jgi:hypothetical protein
LVDDAQEILMFTDATSCHIHGIVIIFTLLVNYSNELTARLLIGGAKLEVLFKYHKPFILN